MLDVILVTHNRLEFSDKTIGSLIGTLKGEQYNVIIVDNASTEEGFDKFLQYMELIHNFKVIRLQENVGWGAAINLALTHSSSEWVLLSNNDVTYKDGWFDSCRALYDKYRERIGVLGLWKHTSHGIRQNLGDLQVKDDMPAVAWLLKREFINKNGPLRENGPCSTKGGNGEDTEYCQRAMANGYWVCGPTEDLATHLTGY